MLYSFSFNGIKKPYLYTEKGKRFSAFAPITRNIQTIPGRPGGYLSSSDTQVRVIEQPFFIKASNRLALRKLEEELAAWLVTAEPKPLILDDEPDRIYYAVVEESVELEPIDEFARGVITFICPDPYKYAQQETIIPLTATTTVNVSGTVKTEPITQVTLSADTTFLTISNGNDVNRIGRPKDAIETTYEPETRKLWDQMGSVTGWGTTNSIEEGVNTGSLTSNGHAFVASTYGTGSNWHGPALKKSIGESLQDFKIEASLTQIGSNGQVGSVEVALLDASNNFVAKILLSKRAANSYGIWGRFRAGTVANGYDILNTNGGYDWVYQYFDGMLRLERKGNQWSAWIGKNTANGYDSVSKATWVDKFNIATTPITQVQVQIWQHGNLPTTSQSVEDIKVYKLNPETGLPIIARTGDIIVFDHKNDVITKNGEEITKDKAFIGDYFSLNPGQNSILIEPSAAVGSAEMRWRNKWL